MAIVSFEPRAYFAHTGGINEKSSEVLVADNQLSDARNLILTQTGALVERYGFEKAIDISSSDTSTMLLVEQFITPNEDKILLITENNAWQGDFSLVSSSFSPSVVSYNTVSDTRFGGFANDTFSGNEYPSFAVANNNAYIADGERIYSFDGTSMQTFGIYPPTVEPSFTSVSQASSSLSTSVFVDYAITFSSSATGYESNPIEKSDEFYHDIVSVGANNSVSIDLSSISVYDPKVDTFNIYRTFQVSDTLTLANRYFLLDSVSTGAAGYLDQKSDLDLGRELDRDNYPLSTFDNVTGLLKTAPSDRIIPQHIFWHQNRMWCASGDDSKLHFSSFGRPESFSPTSFIDISAAKGDNQFITGIGALFDELVIFRNRSVYALTGNDITNFVVRKISDDYGCLSPRSIKQIENGMMFYSNQGWAVYSSGGIIQRVSDNIEDTVRGIVNPKNMAAGVYFDEKQYLCSADLQSSFVLQDSSGMNWEVSIQTTGVLVVSPGGASPIASGGATDSNGVQWSLKVNTSGQLTFVQQSFTTNLPTITDANGVAWTIEPSTIGQIITISGAGDDDLLSPIIVYDYFNNSWTKFTTANSEVDNNVISNVRNTDGRHFVLIGGAGKVFKYSADSSDKDDETNVKSFYQSKFYDYGAPNSLKIFRHLQIEFQKANEDYDVTIECLYDWSSQVSHSFTRTITAGNGVQQERFGLTGNAYSFSFKATMEGANNKPKVFGWTTFAKLRSVRT